MGQPLADSGGFDAQSGAGVAVCIPTYNEAHSITEIVGKTRAALPTCFIVVIDDQSPDGTGQIADQIALHDKDMLVLHNHSKDGLGAAYRTGFASIVQNRPEIEVFVSMDADGSHDPFELTNLLLALRHADVALGSRWVPGGQVRNWPKWRQGLSRGGNAYARFMLGIALGDATGGFRAYKRGVIETIDFESTTSQGYCFQVEMVTRALLNGFRTVEVPITFTERTTGVSKMSNTIVFEAFTKIGGWGLQRLVGQRPLDFDR